MSDRHLTIVGFQPNSDKMPPASPAASTMSKTQNLPDGSTSATEDTIDDSTDVDEISTNVKDLKEQLERIEDDYTRLAKRTDSVRVDLGRILDRLSDMKDTHASVIKVRIYSIVEELKEVLTKLRT